MTTRVRLLAIAALVLSVVACSGGGGAASVSPPADADGSITAQGTKFLQADLKLPADKATKLFFQNLDGQPHNVAIYTDSSASQKLFVGDVITNTATTYQVPAIPAGSYFFRCDVHPTEMTGTVTVGA
jgi:plastocyanin